MTPSSLPHRGPHAVFTVDELRRIRRSIRLVAPVVGAGADQDADIIAKIDVALNSDPKLRTPAT